MPGRNPRFERFFARDRQWHDEFIALREILLECGLDEELKWRQPCYGWKGENVVILAGLKEFCALSFFRGVLMDDPEGLLQSPGPNSRAARYMTFGSQQEIAANRATIMAYVRNAIGLHEAGKRVDFDAAPAPEMPGELAQTMAGDESLKGAFHALTPGRQRSWLIHFNGAKQQKTRLDRIARARPRILGGKGWNER